VKVFVFSVEENCEGFYMVTMFFWYATNI